MSVTYELLGRNDKIRQRRYNVLSYHLRCATPDDIANNMGIPVRTVYNDLKAIYELDPPAIPIKILKQMQNSAFELKIRELEGKSQVIFGEDTKSWIALQKVILDNRIASLKLMGLYTDKVEHSGTVVQIIDDIEYYEGNAGPSE